MAAEYPTKDFCQLIAQNNGHKTVDFQENQVVRLGRGSLTGITDKRCSRDQVEISVDIAAKEIEVRQLGSNPSVAGSRVLHKTQQCTIGPGAVLELPQGYNKYFVFFGKKLVSDSTELALEAPPKKKRLDMAVSQSPPPSPPPRPIKASSSHQRSLLSLFRSEPTTASSWNCKWYESESLLVMIYGEQTPSHTIAAFDLDGTITDTRSGKLPFNTTPDDWRFWDTCVPAKLASAHKANYRIVVFTNQGGMPYGNPSRSDFQEKLQTVMESLGDVPVILLASKVDNHYRKPSPGMFSYFVKHENGGLEVNREESYYIGDAAGRAKNWKPGRKKDFSCSDRKFAKNIGLPFYTPEEYFLGEHECTDYDWNAFNPFSITYDSSQPVLSPPGAILTKQEQELLVLVGYPASGKTTLYNGHLRPAGYRHVNRDTLGTWQKCMSECRKILKEGGSVVIDNTSPDPTSRNRYIKVAQELSLPVRCLWVTTSYLQSYHNNQFRKLAYPDKKHNAINDLAFNSFKSKFKPPRLEEGFTEIIEVTISIHFTDERLKDLYQKFYE